MSAPAPAVGAPGPADPVGCDCGNRRGLSRWMRHKVHSRRHIERAFVGFREEFNEWPLGAALYTNCRIQTANAEAAHLVFHHFDFVDQTAKLNVRGMDRIREIAPILPVSFAPVIIERTPTRPELAEARRSVVLAELARCQFPVPEERVVIGPSPSIGRDGVEEVIIYGNILGGTASGTGFRTGGAGGGGGGGGPTGFDGSGLSGGALFAPPAR